MDNQNIDPKVWIEDYGDYLFNFALSRVYDKMTAEDLVQETLLSAVKAQNSFEGKSTVKTWLSAILKRKIIDYYRKSSRNKEDNILDGDNAFQTEGILKGHWEDNQLPTQWNVSLPEEIESKEFMGVLQKCLSELPPKMAAIFSLKEIEGYSTDEICDELDISKSNLWVMMHRARVTLRKRIEEEWFA